MTSRRPKKRAYRMSARAEAAAATGLRIVDAAMRHFLDRPYDEVTLDEIARDAGVTVQTVLRRYGSKEGLVAATLNASVSDVRRARFEAPVGDLAGAVRNLVEHYELWGDRSIRALSQEERVPALRVVTTAGRALHHEWVDHAFSPWLSGVEGDARVRLRAQLVAATDVYVWKIVRRDLGLDRDAAERAIRDLVAAIVGTARRT